MNNQKCKVFADSYNTGFVRRYLDNSYLMIDIPENFGNEIFDADNDVWYWSSAVSVTLDKTSQNSSDDKIFIGEGFGVWFKLSKEMHFGDNINGYNGCVSFSWYSNDDENKKYGNEKNKSIPQFLHSLDYNSIVKNNMATVSSVYTGCGLSPQLFANDGTYGFTLTLFPDTLGLHGGSTRVAYYELCVKNYVSNSAHSSVSQRLYQGYMPKSIDLSLDSFLYVNESFEEYHFYLNNVKLCSIPININNTPAEEDLIKTFIKSDDNNTGGCWFNMLVSGAIDSPVKFYVNKLDYLSKLDY